MVSVWGPPRETTPLRSPCRRARSRHLSNWTPDCMMNHFAERGEENMPLINVVFVLIVVGVGLWLINRYIPMASSIKTILNIVVVIAVCVWLLQAVGLWGDVTSFRLTR
jgi:predicted membrane protein